MGVPTDIGPTALYYRADLFEKAGLPGDPAQVAQKIKSWDDYIAAGKQMQQKLPGVFMVDNITRMFNQQIRQQETLFVNRDNVYVGNDDQVKHAWDTAASMIPAGVSAEVQNGTPDRNAALSNGTVASFVGAAWEKQILMDAAPQTAGKWRIAPAPGRPGNDGGSFLTIPESVQTSAGGVRVDLVPAIAAKLVAPAGQHPALSINAVGVYAAGIPQAG